MQGQHPRPVLRQMQPPQPRSRSTSPRSLRVDVVLPFGQHPGHLLGRAAATGPPAAPHPGRTAQGTGPAPAQHLTRDSDTSPPQTPSSSPASPQSRRHRHLTTGTGTLSPVRAASQAVVEGKPCARAAPTRSASATHAAYRASAEPQPSSRCSTTNSRRRLTVRLLSQRLTRTIRFRTHNTGHAGTTRLRRGQLPAGSRRVASHCPSGISPHPRGRRMRSDIAAPQSGDTSREQLPGEGVAGGRADRAGAGRLLRV